MNALDKVIHALRLIATTTGLTAEEEQIFRALVALPEDRKTQLRQLAA